MRSDDSIVTTDKLSKQFGRFKALRSTTLSVASGETLTIFGRNGAGKSTFLKIVSTLIRSYGGKVHIFGHDLRSAGSSIRRRIGFVSHESFLYEDLTVYDNLSFYARLYHLDDPKAIIELMIERMGLTAKTSTVTRALSRGMKQRLSLGRAFLHHPDLVLLDEPFTGLDESAADILDEVLADFRAGGGTAIMATHNAERGWKHATRVAVLDKGAVVYESAVEATSYDAFRAQYREILSH